MPDGLWLWCTQYPESLINCRIKGRVGKSEALPTTDWWPHKMYRPMKVMQRISNPWTLIFRIQAREQFISRACPC